MNRRMIVRVIILFLFLMTWLPASPTHADTLVTIHGLRLEGKLLSEDGDIVRFETEDGLVMKYPKSEIASLTTTAGSADLGKQEENADAKAQSPQIEKKEQPAYRLEASTGEFEEIVLKTGGVVRGMITKLDDEELEMAVVMGESSVGKTTFSIDRISVVRRLDEEKRQKLKSTLDWLKRTGPGGEIFDSVGRVKRTQNPLLGECWEITTPHFHIVGESTGSFIQAVARRMEQMFEGYQTYFDVPLKDNVLIDVVIFPSARRYTDFLRPIRDSSLLRSAGLYISESSLIITHHEYEAYAARIEAAQRVLEALQSELDRIDRQNRRIRDRNYEIRRGTKWQLVEEREEVRKYARERLDALNRNSEYMSPDEFYRRRDEIHNWREESLEEINEQEEAFERGQDLLDDINAEKRAKNMELRSTLAELDDYNQRLLAEFEKAHLSILYHEAWHAYADMVLTGEGNKPMPLWLAEGMAEFFKNSRVDAANTFVSMPDHEHILELKLAGQSGLIPLRNLFVFDRMEAYRSKADLFYAESWCLTSYLNERFDLRKDGLMLRYLEDLERTEDPIDSFEKVFDVKLDELEADFRYFIYRGKSPSRTTGQQDGGKER